MTFAPIRIVLGGSIRGPIVRGKFRKVETGRGESPGGNPPKVECHASIESFLKS